MLQILYHKQGIIINLQVYVKESLEVKPLVWWIKSTHCESNWQNTSWHTPYGSKS